MNLLQTAKRLNDCVVIKKFDLDFLKRTKPPYEAIPYEIKVAKAAPLIPYIGIRNQLHKILVIEPIAYK